ncbi:MAG: hypothetical protein A3G41_04825 [Elusimicrobia bacterium RIFCSPLOWO2_12_FULL_59_9]|nr:MAG: hypothetical protein A3G41_04825 [Elusimicrobia bacterium RIFCSPLOWO2_12_FULL_59_9]
MTRSISLKINDRELRKIDHSAQTVGVSRNAYINRALRFFNHLYERRLLAKELRRESEQVRQESLAVLREFETFQDEGL